VYGLYYDYESDKTNGKKALGFKGIIKDEKSNDVSLSSIPKGLNVLTYLYFNKDEYSKYCRDYKEYWDWVENRNEARYKNTVSHGKSYDSKNMMHTFRLLEVALEIPKYKKVIVKRPDREFLLNIRKGEFQYKKLIEMAENKLEDIKKAYEDSNLPDSLSIDEINKLLVDIRKDFYKRNIS
jgi:hypothetical protein